MTPAKELSFDHRNGKNLKLPGGAVTVTALWSSGPTSDSAVPPPPARCIAAAWATEPLRVGSRPSAPDGAAQPGVAGTRGRGGPSDWETPCLLGASRLEANGAVAMAGRRLGPHAAPRAHDALQARPDAVQRDAAKLGAVPAQSARRAAPRPTPASAQLRVT